MTDNPTKSELTAELEGLRARLTEAEEVLRAIRSGDVDAVVVSGQHGEQVYTLSGADRVYRQIIETMSEGALTLSADGVILYCNACLAEMLGRPLNHVLGSALRDYLPRADQEALDAILAQAGTQISRGEITLKAREGRLVPVYVSVSRLHGETAEIVFCLVLTDLTEQNRHKEVIAAEKLASSILEQAAEAVIVCDEQGRVTRASHAALRYCDGSPLLRSFTEVCPLHTNASAPFHLAPVLQGEMVRDLDVTLDRQGHTVDLILNVGPLRTGQNISGCVVTLTDITERKRDAEEAQAVLRTAMDGYWVADMQGRLLDTNEAYCRLSGYTRDELLAMRITDVEGGEWEPEIARHIAAVAETGSARFLTRHRTKGGALRDVEISVNYLPLKGGRLFCFVRDITDRLRTEESHSRLATAVEQAAEAVVITDSNAVILYVNPAFERTSGYSREEAIGQNSRFLKSGKQDAEFYRRMWASLTAGQLWSGQIFNKHKNGTLFEEHVAISPVRDARGEIINYVAVKRDVTREVELEAQVRQAQKMEAVGQLAGGVAHDFNNLLTVINGRSQLMYSLLKPEDPSRHEFELILRTGERAARLTRQLLAFSRRQVLEPKLLDLNALVSDMDRILHQIVREDVQIELILDPHLNAVVADPGQIEQVLMNLILNARDAMPGGGVLTIETKNVVLDENHARSHPDSRPGPHVMLAISDSGCGMDEKILAHIFEPFFTTKELGKGTGLGLSTVFGIVKQSGGSVVVHSEVGKGSTFAAYLPEAEGERPATDSQAALPPVPRGTEVILVVEDEAALRVLVQEILQMNSYTVLAAGDAMGALRVFETYKGTIDLLITDVVMPGMGGPELAQQLVRLHPTLRVLFVSGYADHGIVQGGALQSGLHFLQKPFTPTTLARKVREVLDST